MDGSTGIRLNEDWVYFSPTDLKADVSYCDHTPIVRYILTYSKDILHVLSMTWEGALLLLGSKCWSSWSIFSFKLGIGSALIFHTSDATFHSAFTSLIGWRTNMHKAWYVLSKGEWNYVWTDIISTFFNVQHKFQEETPMVQPASFAYSICLYQITPSSATNNPCNYYSTFCRIFTYYSNMKHI